MMNLTDKQNLLELLERRFKKHMHRHNQISWDELVLKLSDKMIDTIWQMEETGGQPDAVNIDEHLFYIDMSKESPKDRGSICYDKKAREERKKFPPKTSVFEMLDQMNANLLDESMYKKVQMIEDLDLKTSSWILTPENIRSLGGALFGDKRYNQTFIYHNGADSYYGSRGFRSFIKIY